MIFVIWYAENMERYQELMALRDWYLTTLDKMGLRGRVDIRKI